MADNIAFSYKKNLKSVLLSDLIDDYLLEFEQQYDYIFGGRKFFAYDKTAPKYIKGEVLSFIKDSMLSSIENLDLSGDITIEAIDLDSFVAPSPGETDSLKLFYFYLYGTPGEYVSISLDTYKKIFGSKNKSAHKLGRFGTMFMMSTPAYKKMYANSAGQKKGWPTPSSIRHPFSGSPPARIFEIVQEKVLSNFDKYLEKAMDLTIKY